MKWNHHIPLICELKPISGYFVPETSLSELLSPKERFIARIPNKGYRNLAYVLNAFITNATQTIIDTGGASRTFYPRKAIDAPNTSLYLGSNCMMSPYSLNVGSSTSPHDVTRYELYSRYFSVGAHGIGYVVPESDKTKIVTYHRYAFAPPSKAVGEAGLYMRFASNNYYLAYVYHYHALLARAIIDPVVEKIANVEYEEGWEIVFPANYTKWFVDAVQLSEMTGEGALGPLVMDATGAYRIARYANMWAGSPDVMIGSDNSPPSPTDYHLKAPIASLSSQTHAVEIDTTLQECRIVRTGTYTPAATTVLGEVALYTNIYDDTGTARKIMIARGIWDPPVTLEAGVTYTIGIALRLG